MKITFLLLFVIACLNASGQNFRPTSGHSNADKYAANNYKHVVDAINSSRSTKRPFEPQVLSNHINSLTTLTDFQIIDSIYTWQWDSLSQEWIVDYRIMDILYNSEYLPEYYVAQRRTGNSWTNDIRYTLAFNSNNQITHETEEEWDGHQWEFSFQTVNTYDEQQNLTSESYQTWGGDFWQISGRNLYTYDTANYLLSLISQSLNIDEYENENQYLYTYDQDGNQTHELGQYWFDTQWNDLFQIFNTFDHQSNQLFDLVQTFDGVEWTNFSQSGFQYDAQNNRTYHLRQSWNGIEWENEFQNYYTFDLANNPATDVEQSWNGIDWETYLKGTYNFDPENFIVNEVYHYFLNGAPQASIADSTHYYYHIETGIKDTPPSLQELIISPNPTSGIFTIDLAEEIVAVSVYSITGALINQVKSLPGLNHMQLDISENNPGIYTIQARTAKAVYCARIMLH